MQKTASGVRGGATVHYRERLSPSLWTVIGAAVAAPMAALVFAPIDTTLALVAGVLGGAFRMMGFFRWPIAVPYLAEQMAAAPTEEMRSVVALLEGLINRYAGMTIGEHLGFWDKVLGRCWSVLR